MLTKENVKQLVRVYLHEACGYLGINDSQIGIIYMPMPVSMMMVMLLKDSDDIVIDNKLLADVVEQNTYTKLRFEIYHVAREIYQRRKHQAEGTQEDIKADTNDAYAFAYALIFLNGLSLIIPHQFVDDWHPRILHILNNEFHENCVLHSSPDRQVKGEFIYRAKKIKEARQAELKLHTATKPVIVSPNISNNEKGSETHPFDNVLEACRFIKEEERKAFEKDDYMSNILAKRQFNYCADINIYNIKWADGKASYCHSELPADAFIEW